MTLQHKTRRKSRAEGDAGEEKVSVRTLARHLGLSPATVSLALNGRKPIGFVSAATRNQVWEAAREMGYPLERLRVRRPLLEQIAVFLYTGPNPLYTETALELCRALSPHRVRVLTHMTRTDAESATVAADLHRRHEIEAAVLRLDSVVRALGGKPARKVVVVPRRIVNVVG